MHCVMFIIVVVCWGTVMLHQHPMQDMRVLLFAATINVDPIYTGDKEERHSQFPRIKYRCRRTPQSNKNIFWMEMRVGNLQSPIEQQELTHKKTDWLLPVISWSVFPPG